MGSEKLVLNRTQSGWTLFRSARRGDVNWQVHLFLISVIVVIGLPVFYAMMMSTQSLGESLTAPLLPGTAFSSNLERVIERDLGPYMMRSMVVALTVTLGKTILSLMAGMAFAFFRFRGKWIMFALILFTLMLPQDVLLIALFRFISGTLDWGNTFIGLVAPTFASATGTFVFRQHFQSIPSELSEAAQLDGMNPFQFLIYILIPLSWNTVGALFVIAFMSGWNMYLWPLMIITDPTQQVVQVGLNFIIQGNERDVELFGPLMLGALAASIPPLLVFMAMQRQFMRGFAITRDK